ncbi:MAG: two-component system nitrate/nitrite response regulator NarL [Planctomycetota bacterium]|jgi:two-component system nitrate/nitrite response regulator NarL
MRCIAIDDEPTARLALGGLLESLGLVDDAGNARDGLDMIRAAMEASRSDDLVCLDLSMPGTDGIETLNEIRELDEEVGLARTGVIMVTSSDDKTDVIEAFRRQADGYLVKPVSKARLGEAIGRMRRES